MIHHVRGLQKKDVKAVVALPSPGDDDGLRRIADATESVLQHAHS